MQIDLDRLLGRAPLARVVEQVRHRAIDALGFAPDERRLQVHLKNRVRASLCTLHRAAHDLIQGHVVQLALGLGAARQLDHVADERA